MVCSIWCIYVLLITIIYGTSATPARDNPCYLSQSKAVPNNDIGGVSAECHCSASLRECFNIIKWSRPPHHSLLNNYRISFYRDGLASERECFKVPSTQAVFNFSKEHGYRSGTYYTFSVSPDPIMGFLTEHLYVIDCPRIAISENLPNVEVSSGLDYSFRCNYSGSSDTSRVQWTFSSDSKFTISNNNHFHIITTKDFSTLSIRNATKSEEGEYSCTVSDIFGNKKSEKGYLKVNDIISRPKKWNLGLIIGLVLISVFVILCIKFIDIKRRTTHSFQPLTTEAYKPKVYISHCSISEKDKKLVFEVASLLQNNVPGLTVILDLIKETEIHSVGGKSQWVHGQMCNADRIAVMVTNDYVNALKEDEKDDEENGGDEDRDGMRHKVRAEYAFLKMMQYQLEDKVVLINVDVMASDFPDFFKGRLFYNIPQNGSCLMEDFEMRRILEIVRRERNVTSLDV